MFLEEIIIVIQTPLLAGIIGGSIVVIVQNLPFIIKKRINAEIMQKLKMESMIEVINGAEELQSMINQLNVALLDITSDMLSEIRKKNYLQVDEIVMKALEKFCKDSDIPFEKINKFLFLVLKEGLFNEEIAKEYDLIEKNLLRIKNIRKEMIDAIVKIKDSEINSQNINEVREGFNELAEEADKKVQGFICPLMFVYKIKLDKEQEGLFDKLLLCFRKVKKRYKNKKEIEKDN